MPQLVNLPSIVPQLSDGVVAIDDPAGAWEAARSSVADLLSLAWPVGSIYCAAVDTNPATLLGFGTWTAFGAGRVMVGKDTGDADFDTLEETGGAKTVTLTEAQIPAHTHMQRRHATTTGALSGLATAPDTSSSNPGDLGPVTGATGGGGSHNNVQPYIVVRMWKRTA